MKSSLYRIGLPCLITGLSVTPALATNGYFSHGYGTASKGMGGAGVALSLGSLSAATNPASNAFLGNSMDLGLAYFNPNREYEVNGNPSGYPGTFGLMPTKVKSNSKGFALPHAGVNWQWNGNSSFGLAIYGNGGMNTNYHAPVFGSDPTGVNLMQLFIAPTYAIKFSEQHAFGASLILCYQKFKADGLGAFSAFSDDPAHLTNRGNDSSTGYGLRMGYLGRFGNVFSVGASYQSQILMGDFKKYAGLYAEQGGFDIPSNWTLGVAYTPTQDLTFALDFQKINYNDIPSIGNPMLPNMMQAPLGSDDGAGFGWRDMKIVKLGVQWKTTEALTLRAGYANGRQPIPEREVMFNILAPGVIEQHATLGGTFVFKDNQAMSFSLMKAFSKSVKGANPLEAPGQQTITLRMDQWELEFGYSFKF